MTNSTASGGAEGGGCVLGSTSRTASARWQPITTALVHVSNPARTADPTQSHQARVCADGLNHDAARSTDAGIIGKIRMQPPWESLSQIRAALSTSDRRSGRQLRQIKRYGQDRAAVRADNLGTTRITIRMNASSTGALDASSKRSSYGTETALFLTAAFGKTRVDGETLKSKKAADSLR